MPERVFHSGHRLRPGILERADRCHLAAGIRHRWRRDHAGNLHRRPGRQADHYCRPTGLNFQLTETPALVLLGGLIARELRKHVAILEREIAESEQA
jgi:hypothetical protein